MNLAQFTFNPFSENTYVLYDETKECVIVDPGCSDSAEQKELVDFLESNGLNPVSLFNTHCHIDHVLGNKFISEKYNLPLASHKGEAQELAGSMIAARMYGIAYDPSPEISIFYEEGDVFKFGNTQMQVLFTPGHSSSSICLFHKESNQLIAGDVLFYGSIGRTDLPGGDHETLIRSIKEKLMIISDEVRVYPGHGPSTTIGFERENNPFINGHLG